MALGGGRAAIVRQLLVESLLLALCGGAIGAGIGTVALGWLKRLGADSFESWHPITIDLRVLAVTMGIAMGIVATWEWWIDAGITQQKRVDSL